MSDLRIADIKRGRKIPVSVNGKKLTAHEGETVHALLAANGISILRKTVKKHEPRGLLCGMGVCYECLVTINNVPDQQACMTLVTENMEILVNENPA